MSILRPLFALFARSLREQSRTKFTSVSRAAIVLVILFFIGANERSFLSRSAPGLQVLMTLAWVNFFAITVFGLSTFPSAITEEKEEDTLGLLRMTQLNPLSILLGKSTARLFDGFLLLAVQLPFTMLCITLGGVAQSQILRTYGILAAYLFLLCNVGLLWSVVCRRTKRAASMTTITGMVIYVLPLFFFGLLLAGRFRSGISGQAPGQPWYQTATEWLYSINPVFDLTKTISPRGLGLPLQTDSMLPSLVLGVIAFALAWFLFDRCCSTAGEAVARPVPKADGGASGRRIAFPRPGRFAIAWKDFHFLNGGFRGIVVRTVIYMGLIGAFLLWLRTINRSLYAEAVGETFRYFGLIAFSMELGLAATRIFGIERKRKTLGGLFTLPPGTGSLIWQKVLGALPVLVPSGALYFLGEIVLENSSARADWQRFSAERTSYVILVAFEYTLFAVLVAYLSLRMRRAALASALALIFFGHLVLGTMFYRGTESAMAGSVVISTFIVIIAAGIPRRIAAAAAEE